MLTTKEHVKAKLILLGKTQVELAKICGIRYERLNRIMNGIEPDKKGFWPLVNEGIRRIEEKHGGPSLREEYNNKPDGYILTMPGQPNYAFHYKHTAEKEAKRLSKDDCFVIKPFKYI